MKNIYTHTTPRTCLGINDAFQIKKRLRRGTVTPFSIRSLLLAGLVAIGFCFGLLAQTNNPNKVDDDGDGLIEIWTLSDLDNIRYNPAGTSYDDEAADSGSGDTGITTGCGTALSGAQRGKCHGYELMNDLDFRDSSATGYNLDWVPTTGSGNSRTVVAPASGKNPGWPPIGDTSGASQDNDDNWVYPNAFSGTLDGNNHTISNLYVNLKSTANEPFVYAGLFAFVSSGELKNIRLAGTHTSVSGTSTHGDANRYSLPSTNVGCLVGLASGATITSCHATGNVSASSTLNSHAGGLVGHASSSSTITSCHATGNVSSSSSSESRTGGLVGYAHGGTMTNCYATGNVTSPSSGSDSSAGGLVGYVDEDLAITFRNCYATGDVEIVSATRNAYAGGLVGKNTENSTFKNCYATGDVSSFASDNSYAGGLLAYIDSDTNTTVTNCYATGNVTSVASRNGAYAGGVVGKVNAGVLRACYYSGTVKKGDTRNSLTNVRQVSGRYKTETELKTPTSNTGIYADWSTSNWNFGSATELPTLREYVPPPSAPAKPALTQKQSGLTRTGQVYTATFSGGGTLYYLLRAGGKSSSVTKANIKAGASPVGMNKGNLSATGNITLGSLSAGTLYTLYAIVEAASGGLQSGIVAVPFRTTAAAGEPPSEPTFQQKDGALTATGQVYTATFSGGTLYYLLRAGAKDSNVTKANIRAGTSPSETNKGSLVATDDITLFNLSAGTLYTLYAIVAASGGSQSGIVAVTFRTAASPLRAPTLKQKPNVLTRTGQVYTATFTGGTLYYLLRAGGKSSSVTKANIRAGTSPVGTNKGNLSATGDITLGSLSAGTLYTLYAIVEAASGGLQSDIVAVPFRTAAAAGEPPSEPTFQQKDGALTAIGQVYTATFTGGTLYYLLQAGRKNSNLTKAHIKDGVSPVGTNKGNLTATGDVSLTGLRPRTEYTLYAVVVASDDQQSERAAVTFTTAAPPLPTPTLKQKPNALAKTSQAYTAAFSGGTLYYLLRKGGTDASVTETHIKDGTSPAEASTNKGSATTSPKEILLTGLRPGDEYTLFAVVLASDDQPSGIVMVTFTTMPLSSARTLAQNTGASTSKKQVFTATFTGTLYYLLRAGDHDDKVTKADIKAGTSPAGASTNKGKLTATGNISLTGLSFGAKYTLYAVVESSDGPTLHIESVTFAATTSSPMSTNTPKMTIRAYPNPTSGVLRVPVSEGVAVVFSSDGVEVGIFDVSAGQIELTGLPMGVYVVRLSDGSVFRIMKHR